MDAIEIAREILAIVDSETDAKRYAEIVRTANLGVPLARLMVLGMAEPTENGAEILADTLAALR